MRIAYMMSRFPKLTETFVLYEMLAMETVGQTIEIYPLINQKESVVQEEARNLTNRARYTGFISLAILLQNLKSAFSQPKTYFGTLATLIRANWGSWRFLLGKLAYFPKAVYLAKRMKEEQIEHIHAHFASFPAAVAYMIHQFSGIPYSFTAHGSDLHRDQHMLCEKISDAKAVISISEYNKQMMIDHCGKEHAHKIHIVHCGINLERFKAVSNLAEGELSIVCVGTLHEVKGQKFLIEACGKLKERGIPFHCHFVGDGEDLAMLEELATKLGIRENISFHGRLTQAGVIERLQAANVVSLNSVPSADGRREGIPVALMEAMAFRLPVVSTRLSGIPELVEEGVTGYLTDIGDSQAIADALAKLGENPALREQMGIAGRKKIEAEFELYENARQLANIIQSANGA
jgi:colanic acid/amylovoran biosynthesis glycosyltransferase